MTHTSAPWTFHPRRAALDEALAFVAGAGECSAKADAATADYFDPPLRNLLYTLYLWTWASRARRDLLPKYRRNARVAIAAYRSMTAYSRERRA